MAKGNNGAGNTVERDEWQTPQWLFNKLDQQYRFRFDCCADKQNTKCRDWTDDFLSFFMNIKNTVCWMNPPFSKATKMFNHFFSIAWRGVCIYRCDNMETKIWQKIIFKNANWILIPDKRICYEGFEGKGSRFPSALIGFNIQSPEGIKGTILLIKKENNT